MDRAEQARGEKRVREILVDPLERLGLQRPSGMTVRKFDDMVQEICEKLSYMSAGNLAALREQVSDNPEGKNADRWPSGIKILKYAGKIQPPPEDASPLIRAVFEKYGQEAIDGDWAAELLGALKRNRVWPGDFALHQMKERAAENARTIRRHLDEKARGRALPAETEAFIAARAESVRKCRRILELMEAEAAA